MAAAERQFFFFGGIVAKFPAHQQRATRWCMVGLKSSAIVG